MQSNEGATLETPYKPVKTRGDRGNQYKRSKLIAGRSPKEMGVKVRMKQRKEFYAFCDHRNPKTNKRQCSQGRDKKPFTGWSVQIVMGNKASHEDWHEKEDRRLAEMAGIN